MEQLRNGIIGDGEKMKMSKIIWIPCRRKDFNEDDEDE
jgi:hypothetical protein